jgi:hypothetical protein
VIIVARLKNGADNVQDCQSSQSDKQMPERQVEVITIKTNKNMEYIFNEGGMWEDSQFTIETDVPISIYHGTIPCKHCHSITEFDGVRKCICPTIVIALNEGGFNSTGVCLDCIIEASEKIKKGISE